MAGLLQMDNQNRKIALGQMGYLSGLSAQRDANNQALRDQASAQRKQAIGSGIGTIGVGLATGNPILAGMGAIGLLGSLF